MFVKMTALLFSVCVVAVLVVALSSISGAPCADALSINTGLNTANEVVKTDGSMYFLTDCTLIILVFLLIFSMLLSIAKRDYNQINTILQIIFNILRDIT